MVYINDILIFTRTEEGHDKIVQEVLHRLRTSDLFLKPEKCFFKQWEIEFLGLIIGSNGVEIEPSKVKGIMNWPTPTKVKEVQSFLGLANFYCQFVKDFSKIAALLHKLTRNDQKWEWDAVHQRPLMSWRKNSQNNQSWWWLILQRSYASNQMLPILLLALYYPWSVMMTSGVRATPKPASSMAHSTVTRALALWAHT